MKRFTLLLVTLIVTASATAASLNDLWLYDGVADRWTKKATAVAPGAPSPRQFMATAFDPDNEDFYVFPGNAVSSANIVHKYNMSSNQWTTVTVTGDVPCFADTVTSAGTVPIAKDSVNEAFYDEPLRQFVFPVVPITGTGRRATIVAYLIDEQRFEAVAGSEWPYLTPADEAITSAPADQRGLPERPVYPATTFDFANRAVYVFSGSFVFPLRHGAAPVVNSPLLWRFQLPETTATVGQWALIGDKSAAFDPTHYSAFTSGLTVIPTTGTSPESRIFSKAIVDIANNRLNIIGGNTGESFTSNDYTDHTYELNLDTFAWTQYQAPPRLYRIGQIAACYDHDANVPLVFGGLTRATLNATSEFTCYNEVWQLDCQHSKTWSKGIPPGLSPAIRRGSGMTYIGDNKVLLFGGEEIAPGAQVRTTIISPAIGADVSGLVPILAAPTYGVVSKIEGVIFEYSDSTTATVWTEIGTSVTHTPFSTVWDTEGLTGTLYVRARAKDKNTTDPTKASYSDRFAPHIVVTCNAENTETTGTENGISQNAPQFRINDASVSDSQSKTTMFVRLPKNSVQSSTTIDMSIESVSLPTGFKRAVKSAPGINVGRVVDVALGNGQTTLGSPMKVICQFADADNDGVVDDTDILVQTLKIYRVDGSNYTQMPSVVDEYTATVRTTTTQTGAYVMLGQETASVGEWTLYQ